MKESAKTIQVSNLQALRVADLRAATEPITITSYGRPIAVIVPYEYFLRMQGELVAAQKLMDASR